MAGTSLALAGDAPFRRPCSVGSDRCDAGIRTPRTATPRCPLLAPVDPSSPTVSAGRRLTPTAATVSQHDPMAPSTQTR
eukprot:11515712-Alexandrium_andersonii.AAC.1